jgi:hypothetical protein
VAMNDYKRPVPTWREILAVVHALGYRKVAEATALPRPLVPINAPRGEQT